MPNTTLHFQWIEPLAHDLARASRLVVASALSLHPPRSQNPSPLNTIWHALRQAVNNGADVNFYLPAPAKSHPATALNLTAAMRLHAIGAHPHLVPLPRLIHAKTVSIDNAIAWVGSGNWTAAAATHNHEAYLRTEGPDIAAKLAHYWNQQWPR